MYVRVSLKALQSCDLMWKKYIGIVMDPEKVTYKCNFLFKNKYLLKLKIMFATL